MQTLYKFRGTVNTVDELSIIENRNIGDTYKCKADSDTYIWNGVEWINAGQDVDYSEILDKINEVNTQIQDYQEENNLQISNINNNLSIKVDKIEGKGLSSNDFTTDYINKINNKVEKVNGKGLSTNDFTDTYKSKLDGISTGANKTNLYHVHLPLLLQQKH